MPIHSIQQDISNDTCTKNLHDKALNPSVKEFMIVLVVLQVSETTSSLIRKGCSVEGEMKLRLSTKIGR